MRRTIIAMGSSVVLALALVGPASATKPVDVTFVNALSTIDWYGPFVATGPAVDAGIMCPEGTIVSLGDRPWPTGPRYPEGFFTVGVYKGIVCDNDDPEFDAFVLRLQARGYPGVGTVFTWEVLHGWGRFARLHGVGKGTGTYGENLITDTYTGAMHLD